MAVIRFQMLSYVFVHFHMLSYALYAFSMLLVCFNMLLFAFICFMSLLEQQEEEMMLTLCLTGFCSAEAGKNLPRLIYCWIF